MALGQNLYQLHLQQSRPTDVRLLVSRYLGIVTKSQEGLWCSRVLSQAADCEELGYSEHVFDSNIQISTVSLHNWHLSQKKETKLERRDEKVF